MRHDAGVATIADVLQARTAVSQAELTLLTFEGTVTVFRGALATSMGLPASIPLADPLRKNSCDVLFFLE